jgi:hypothetical protein
VAALKKQNPEAVEPRQLGEMLFFGEKDNVMLEDE